MNVKTIPIKDIKPYEKNTKRHDKEQVQAVANSIKEFGWTQPIVIDRDNVIVIGHCRYEAARQLGLAEVPCVQADELTEEQTKALRLVDNKTNESEWDYDKLAAEIEDLPEYDFTSFGFGEFELSTLNGADDEFVVEEELQTDDDEVGAEWRTEPENDISDDTSGRIIVIMHGDEEIQWLKDKLNIEGDLEAAYRVLGFMEKEEQEWKQ